MISIPAGGALGTAVSLVLLLGVLGFAVVRPFGWPEAVGAGLVPWRAALGELTELGRRHQ